MSDYTQYDNPWWFNEPTFANLRVQTRVIDKSVNRLGTRAGGLEFVFFETLNPDPKSPPEAETERARDLEMTIEEQEDDQKQKENSPPEYTPVNADKSYVLLQDKYGGMLRLVGGNVMLKSTSSAHIAARQDLMIESAGHYQNVVGRDSNTYVIGNSRFLHGRQDQDQYSKLLSIKTLIENIHTKRIGELYKPGEDIDCPVCNTPLLVDMYSYSAAPVGDRESIFDLCATDHVKGIILQKFNTFEFSHVPRTSLEARQTAGPPQDAPERGVGCGSLGCVDGMAQNLLPVLEEATKAAEDYEGLTKQIKAIEEEAGQGGDTSYGFAGDVTYRYGLFMNNLESYVPNGYHLYPLRYEFAEPSLEDEATRAGLIYSTEGNAQRMIYAEPPVTGPGSVTISVGQKMTTVVGLSYELLVNAKAHITAAGVEIAATKGEAILSSKNLTILRGENLILDATTGIHVQADNMFVAGGFSVSGDAGFKGHITTDGAISCPYLVMPSMSQTTSFQGTSKFINHDAMWDPPPDEKNPNRCYLAIEKMLDENGDIIDYRIVEHKPTTGVPAFVTSVKQILYDFNFKMKYKFDWWQHSLGLEVWSKDIAYLLKLVTSPLESYPTGIATSTPMAAKCFCPRMAELANDPKVVSKYPAIKQYSDGMSPGIVMPGGVSLVTNFRHHHLRWGDSHDHEAAMPVGSYTQSTWDWGMERISGSPAATPHPIKGDGLMYGRGAKGTAVASGEDNFRADKKLELLRINYQKELPVETDPTKEGPDRTGRQI